MLCSAGSIPCINGDFRFSPLIIQDIIGAIQKMSSWWNCHCCSIVSFTFKTCYIQPKFILCRFSVLLFLKNITPIKSRSLAIALVVVRLSKLLTFVWKFLRFYFLSVFVFVFVFTLVRNRLKISFSFWNLIRRLEKIYFKPHIKHRRGRAPTIYRQRSWRSFVAENFPFQLSGHTTELFVWNSVNLLWKSL